MCLLKDLSSVPYHYLYRNGILPNNAHSTSRYSEYVRNCHQLSTGLRCNEKDPETTHNLLDSHFQLRILRSAYLHQCAIRSAKVPKFSPMVTTALFCTGISFIFLNSQICAEECPTRSFVAAPEVCL